MSTAIYRKPVSTTGTNRAFWLGTAIASFLLALLFLAAWAAHGAQ